MRRKGLCSDLGQIWAISDFPPLLSTGDPEKARIGQGCGPHVGHFSCSAHAALWEPLRRLVLCSHLAHMWATSEFLGVLSSRDQREGSTYVSCGS